MARYNYIHSTIVKTDQGDAVIANVKDADTNVSKLVIQENPMVPFWITKPAYRNHEFKKEYAQESELDGYIAPSNRLGEEIYRALNDGRPPRGFIRFKQLLDSPYVYGADIEPEVLLKCKIKAANPDVPPPILNIGALDIETSVLGGNEIICATFVDGTTHEVYCSIYKPFMGNNKIKDIEGKITKLNGTLEDLKERVRIRHKDFFEGLNDAAKKLVDAKPFHVNYHITDDELDEIQWLFDRINDCKPDFVCIWNMGYDIPYIIDRIRFRQGNPADVMSHPDVPPKWRYCNFRPDRSEVDHITDRWDWLDLTSYTCFVDSMCLYGRIRKVKGREISYRLEYIATKDLGTGKLDFGQGADHHVMQEEQFLDYVAYNIIDAVLLVLLDEMNEDISNLVSLSGYSRLQDFSRQTVQLKNYFYAKLREQHCVTAAVGNSMLTKWDTYIANVGGGVLSPTLAKNTGIAILEEASAITDVCKYAADIDVTSFYPSAADGSNISKETKLFTTLAIEGFDPGKEVRQKIYEEYGSDFKTNKSLPTKLKDQLDAQLYEATKATSIHTEDYFGNVVAPYENGVYVCHKFFNLPNYTEMLELFNQEHGVN